MKILSIVLFSLLLLASKLAMSEVKKTEKVINPFHVMPFALPKGSNQSYAGYRKNWSRLTGFEYSGLHWKQFVTIFVNKGADIYRENYLAYLSLYRDEDDDDEDEDEETEQAFKAYPDGTIFLKENYLAKQGKPGEPSSLTLMIKRQAGYDQQGGNWEYLQSDVNGNIIMQGNSQDPDIKSACADCHLNMAERDYIFSTFLTSKSILWGEHAQHKRLPWVEPYDTVH